MGVYGSTLSVTTSSKNDFSASFLNYETGIHAMYSGIDWVYTYVETLYIYDYKIVYFWLLNNVYDESIDFFFYQYGTLLYKFQDYNYFDQLY